MFLRKERTMFDSSGGSVTINRLKSTTGRIGFEKRYFPGLQVSRFGWERSFESAPGTVQAGSSGLLYAPPEVHQFYERLGLERFISAMFRWKTNEVEVWLSSQLYEHPATTRVKVITYQVIALRQRNDTPLFQTSMIIESKKGNPLIKVESTEIVAQRDLHRILR